jgi:predicted N-acetyltransferase YhbS
LSGLAVDFAYQRQRIGRRLIERLALAGDQAPLLLVAAPMAEDYYSDIGLQHFPTCWDSETMLTIDHLGDAGGAH